MKAYDIELILSRQLAECLSIPVFITNTEGTLLFYNEPAEEILGKRFEETGEMSAEEWGTIWKPLDDAGNPLKPEDLPLVKTIYSCQPHHGSFWIESLKGQNFKISVTAYPIVGRGNRYLGAVAIFWKAN